MAVSAESNQGRIVKHSFIVRGAALAAGAGLVVTGVAACTVPTPAKATTTTFQMYANVDAEGHLGSNFDAVSVTPQSIGPNYLVTFTQPIGHCAAAAQAGKAGGTDEASFVSSIVVPGGPRSFVVGFSVPGSGSLKKEPFMLTVTCTR